MYLQPPRHLLSTYIASTVLPFGELPDLCVPLSLALEQSAVSKQLTVMQQVLIINLTKLQARAG